MSETRAVGWFSCGAASAVAVKLALAKFPNMEIAYCETGSEHPDNSRFLSDCEQWFGRRVTRIKSDRYQNTWDVWTRRKYLAGIKGAPCSVELKVVPRLDFQRPGDIQIFGYTSDSSDAIRATRFKSTFPEVEISTPLIEKGLGKSACLEIVQRAGIALPKMYDLGFGNNNCIPCVKATSPAYWALVRKNFPDEFARMAALSRRLGVRLCLLKKERAFIDEIPPNYPTSKHINIACDFLCELAHKEIQKVPA